MYSLIFSAVDLSSITDAIDDLASSLAVYAPGVVASGLVLGAIYFCGPWLLGLFKQMSGGSGAPDPNDPNDIRNYDTSPEEERRIYGYAKGDNPTEDLTDAEVREGLRDGWLVRRGREVRYTYDN